MLLLWSVLHSVAPLDSIPQFRTEYMSIFNLMECVRIGWRQRSCLNTFSAVNMSSSENLLADEAIHNNTGLDYPASAANL